MRMSLTLPFALVALLACRGPGDLSTVLDVTGNGTTGLEGTVTRGPVTPVCQINVPCDAPFKWSFQVVIGSLVVAHFSSDSVGHYRVPLVPGAYAIRADSGAAIWPPDQTIPVIVGPVGMTQKDLQFDTGIR
jgi:hypothetical protein